MMSAQEINFDILDYSYRKPTLNCDLYKNEKLALI